MPRTVEILVPQDRRASLLERLERTDGVAMILVHEGVAHRPAGDLVVIQGTNQAAEAATRIAIDLGLLERGTMSLSEPVGLVAGDRRREIGSDINDSSWEEIDTLLRRDTNPSHNYLLMMTLSGAVAGAALFMDTLHIVIGAMLIAPGFEPLVRIGAGLCAGFWDSARKGVLSTLVGYLCLAIGAAIGMALTAWADPTSPIGDLTDRDWIRYWTEIKWTGVVVAILAGLSGGIVVNSHQTVFATGVMVALALIPAMAIVGMGVGAGQFGTALEGLTRWAVDATCVVLASLLVFGIKRMLIHRAGHG